ncbi:zinc finger protein 728-like [Armigeres subalbatus]|uniref:zinc finger protein 728-like n=1 Tax=Armigeres subalbatus TaxID=124917 RepID=UPI002ED4E774
MESNLNSEQTCYICCQKHSDSNFTEVDLKQDMKSIICQHFWFKNDELHNALVCIPCWEKVNEFHKFYQEVKDNHSKLKLQLTPVCIKQEEIIIEEDQGHQSYDEVTTSEGRFEMSSMELDVNEELSMGTNPEDINNEEPTQEQRRTWKQAKYRKKLSNEERQAQDNVIMQHLSYDCEVCDLEFSDFCLALRHRINVHEQTYLMCCDRQYKTRLMLYQHALNPGAFRCEFCGKNFKLLHGFHRHMKQFHKDEKELLFKCLYCPQSFAHEGMLRRHMVEHDPTKCEVCGKEFANKYGLRRHIKDFHVEQKEFICDICSKGFSRQSMYLEHRVTHDLTAEEMREQCPICNKWLKNHICWEKHVKRHKTEGAQICDICDHVSVNSMSLRVHKVRQHGPNNKKYPCDICGKEYSRAATLKEHVANAHTGEHLYQCQYCLKKFFSSATMYAHRKKDHPKEWLKDHMTKYASKEEDANEKGDSSNDVS